MEHETRPLYRSFTVYGLILVTLIAVSVYYLFGSQIAFEIVNGIGSAVAVGVTISWSKIIIAKMRKHPWEFESDDSLVLGLGCLAISGLVILAFLWTYRITGDDWYRNNELAFLSRVGIAIGFSMLLATSGAIDGRMPPESYRKVGIYVALGLALSAMLIGFGIM
jgi:hypothetical protein